MPVLKLYHLPMSNTLQLQAMDGGTMCSHIFFMPTVPEQAWLQLISFPLGWEYFYLDPEFKDLKVGDNQRGRANRGSSF